LSLDYVYRNQPAGAGPLGRLADRQYLDTPGWRGIRERKIQVEELVRIAIDRLRAAGEPVRMLDIAAGHGRYALEAATSAGTLPESILLRDVDPANVEAGVALIKAFGLEQRARFERGDAFDADALGRIRPQASVAIVSGLYELFGDNAAVQRSLAGLAQAVQPGGYLVYTCQPWHPQLELIARTLTGSDGRPWVMRRRTQAEMDTLVLDAGFQKCEQRIDEQGMFTVSLACRIAA
jgi:SAM-dependent methyltransferase